jgi:hypothetical protein
MGHYWTPAKCTWGCSMIDAVLRLFAHMDCSPDIFLVEALLNGILLAGLLALLASSSRTPASGWAR